MSRLVTKPTKRVCAQRRLRSALASSQSDQSLRCAFSGLLRTQAFFMRTGKTLIRLDGCPGWSESSLGAQPHCWFCHVAAHIFHLYVFVYSVDVSHFYVMYLTDWWKVGLQSQYSKAKLILCAFHSHKEVNHAKRRYNARKSSLIVLPLLLFSIILKRERERKKITNKKNKTNKTTTTTKNATSIFLV